MQFLSSNSVTIGVIYSCWNSHHSHEDRAAGDVGRVSAENDVYDISYGIGTPFLFPIGDQGSDPGF